MKEINLRKFHRLMGIILSLFIIIQGSSGLILSFLEVETHAAIADSEYAIEDEDEKESPLKEFIESIHAEGGGIGFIYRLLVGTGLIMLAGSGSWIFTMVQKRQKRKKSV